MTMDWIAPRVIRVDQPTAADERGLLEGLLDWQRSTMLWKCAGLTGEQLAQRSVPPSTLSLLGLVRHMADAERAWFRRYLRGEELSEVYARDDCPDAAFDEAAPASAKGDFARLTAECDLARSAATGASLDERFVHEQFGEVSLRWVFGHMIAEYARHIGHADLLRQRIDGATGE
jgi:hypothetical protein